MKNTDRFKFRAWFYDGTDLSTGQMESLETCVQEGYVIFEGNQIKPTDECTILMACTGLKDSEGKLVYEGDVVEGVSYKDPVKREVQTTIRGVVVWTDSYGSPRMELSTKLPKGFKTYPNLLTCKVRGNIYENPELLEADER